METKNAAAKIHLSKKNNIIKRTVGEKIFDTFNVIFLGLICFTFIYPFWYLFAVSIADSSKQAMTQIWFLPQYFSLDSYQNVLSSKFVYLGFMWSVIRTVLGTAIALLLSYHFAYALSKKYLPNRNFWTLLLVFTMFFGGGMVPNFLLIKDLGMMNTIWSLVLPGCISAYNITIMRNFLMSIPDSLEEAAFLDGASNFQILFKIVLPLSMPIIATLSLFYAVGRWNAYADNKYYITKEALKMIQYKLYQLVASATEAQTATLSEAIEVTSTPEVLQAACIMFATIPIICIYPFLQKYFVKGVMVGAVKG